MRLVTRGDLDGVTSAVLITTMEDVDAVELIHPQDVTNRKFEITSNDIMANLPYDPRCGMWFDHHELTESNLRPPENFRGRHAIRPSVAKVIYEYYTSEKLRKYERLIEETDRMDSADLTRDDVLDPKEIILLGFTIDSRTGIGSFKDYFLKLVGWLKDMPVSEILSQPEVVDRVNRMRAENESFLSALREHSRRDGNVVITDFRSFERPPVGNRFLIYTLFPETNVSVRLQWGPGKSFVAVTIGHNLFNRTSPVNCGLLCSDFGGGGHKGAGACPLKPEDAETNITEIVRRLREAV